MWILPFAAIYYYLSLKYEKQIAKMQKKYKKWQVLRQPSHHPHPLALSSPPARGGRTPIIPQGA